MIENKDSKQLGIKSVTNIFDEELSQEAKNMLIKLNSQEKVFTTKGLAFREIKILNLILETIGLFMIKKSRNKKKQKVLTALEKYKPTDSEYKNKKIKLLENVKRFYNGREIIINAFKNKIFPLCHEKNIFEDKGEDDIRNKNSLINYKKLERLTFSKRRDINDELVKKNNFSIQNLEALLKKIKKIKMQKKIKFMQAWLEVD